MTNTNKFFRYMDIYIPGILSASYSGLIVYNIGGKIVCQTRSGEYTVFNGNSVVCLVDDTGYYTVQINLPKYQ